MIVTGQNELNKKYDSLGFGDVFVGGLTGTGRKQLMLIDLLERGVKCYPSPLSQMLNGSKVAQSIVLKNYMCPHTVAIFRRHDLMGAINKYNQHKIEAVITKTDKMHCGHGIRKWEDIETLYSFISNTDSQYPFTLQPFLGIFMDVRVIIIGDYIEAYTRQNSDNFRQNISAGGKSIPYKINEKQEIFCKEVMARGKFPYGHIDLQVMESGECYLSEIALNGGIKGACIKRKALEKRKQDLLERLAENL
jgi:ribosomal protein S6--L-glutamate ligase